ncbi:flavin reductase family protein [Streptomyces sp. NPDC056296]|uniref:flavin reductase family protein n=1 Tax=Streptomyces sp. NPDC056296 TaxID=3345775 RepID=UPI0035DCB1AE
MVQVSVTDQLPVDTEALAQNRFRDVMAASPAPVTVVTTHGPDGPAGATVSAFMSLSLEPRLVVVALDRRSRVLSLVEATGSYGVNLLAANQSSLALRFARPGADRFQDTRWHHDHGLPRIEHTAGWLACDLAEVVDGGDHKMLVGAVTDVSCSPRPPLVYSHRQFGTHSKAQQRHRTPIEAQIAALTYC